MVEGRRVARADHVIGKLVLMMVSRNFKKIFGPGGVIVIWDQKQAWAVAAVASVPAHLQSGNYQYATYVVDRVR